jgi:hypothetical protein
MKLSQNFKRSEIERTQVRLPNVIPANQLPFWIEACENILEPIRYEWMRRGGKYGLFISSGYRSVRVNSHVGGSANSSHRGKSIINSVAVKAAAFDIDLDIWDESNQALFEMIEKEFAGKFDQLIWEFGWVHVGYTENPRGKVLKA